jgi:hypothetical protein
MRKAHAMQLMLNQRGMMGTFYTIHDGEEIKITIPVF